MGNPYIIDFKFADDGAAQGIKAAVKSLNEAQAAAERAKKEAAAQVKYRKDLAEFARKEKQSAFEKLPLEQQINQTLAKRLQVQTLLSRAENETVRLALLVKEKQLQEELLALEKKRPQHQGFLDSLAAKAGASGLPGGGLVANLATKLSGLASGTAVAAAAVGLLAKNFIDGVTRSREISALSKKEGISTTGAQKLEFALGSNFEAGLEALKDLKRAQSEALQGSKEQVKNFEMFGITLDQIRNLSPEELFLKMGDAIKAGGLNAANFSSYLQIMGRNGEEILPNLKKGVREIGDEFERLGGIVKTGTVHAISEFGDSAKKAWRGGKGVAGSIGTELSGAMLAAGKLLQAGLIDGVINDEQDARAERLVLEVSQQYDPEYSAGTDQTEKLQRRLDQKLAVKAEGKRQAETKAAEQAAKDKETQTKLGEENAKNAANRKFDSLSEEEKLNFLLEARVRLLARIREENDGMKKEEFKAAELGVEKDLQDLRSKMRSAPEEKPSPDRFARLGLFVGQGYDPTRETGAKQVQELQQVNTRLAAIEASLSKLF